MIINGYEIKPKADLREADLSRANLRYANLNGADLSRANLRYANLNGADLSRANLRYANLNGADLSRANLRYANLNGADLSRANLRYANLNGADLSDADLSDADLRGAALPKTITIKNLFTMIHKAIKDGGGLEMVLWHSCETTHCVAGWVTTLAGDVGRVMENLLGTPWAATLIINQSCPYLNGIVPNFYASNEDAMKFIEECVEKEKSLEVR